jgi:hypothetical protein
MHRPPVSFPTAVVAVWNEVLIAKEAKEGLHLITQCNCRRQCSIHLPIEAAETPTG